MISLRASKNFCLFLLLFFLDFILSLVFDTPDSLPFKLLFCFGIICNIFHQLKQQRQMNAVSQLKRQIHMQTTQLLFFCMCPNNFCFHVNSHFNFGIQTKLKSTIFDFVWTLLAIWFVFLRFCSLSLSAFLSMVRFFFFVFAWFGHRRCPCDAVEHKMIISNWKISLFILKSISIQERESIFASQIV